MEIVLFISFIVVSIIFKIFQPKIKGYLGERSVAFLLSFLPSEEYKIIHDVLIESNNKTVQIDHLVISIYGIFVIETKNYKGWITGSDNSEFWTKNVFGHKYQFYNPIKQNKSHILALSKRLRLHLNKFIPIIVFTSRADLRINTAYNVIYTTQISNLIKEYSDIKFSKNEINKIFEIISSLNITSPERRKEHTLKVQKKAITKQYQIQHEVCPICGHRLVHKKGRYGDFWGCGHYPKCKFTISNKEEN